MLSRICSVENIRLPGILTVFLLLLFATTGCEKKKILKMETLEQTPRLGLPSSLDHVWSFNVKSLKNLDFIRKVTAKMESEPGYQQKAGQVQEILGIDPSRDIDLLLVGYKGEPGPINPFENAFVLARGNFPDQQEKINRLHHYLENELLIDPDPFKKTRHPAGGYDQYSTWGQSQYNADIRHEFHFAFPSNRIMLFSMNKSLISESLDIMAGIAPGIREDPAWIEKLQRPDTGAIIWGLGRIALSGKNSSLPAAVNGMEELKSSREYFASFNLGKEFKIELGLLCSNIEKAGQLTQAFKQRLGEIRKFSGMFSQHAPEATSLLDRIVITTELEVSKIILSLNEDQRHALKTELSAMIDTQTAPTPAP